MTNGLPLISQSSGKHVSMPFVLFYRSILYCVLDIEWFSSWLKSLGQIRQWPHQINLLPKLIDKTEYWNYIYTESAHHSLFPSQPLKALICSLCWSMSLAMHWAFLTLHPATQWWGRTTRVLLETLSTTAWDPKIRSTSPSSMVGRPFLKLCVFGSHDNYSWSWNIYFISQITILYHHYMLERN